MKKLILFLTILNLSLFAQDIPNAGFENWTNGNPDGWFTFDFLGDAVIQSTVSHSGSSAARLEIVAGLTPGSIVLPWMWAGDGSFQGFPINQTYGSLTGFYQFSPVGNDGLFAIVWIYRDNTIIGAGALEIFNSASSYTQFSAPIEYNSSEVPDSAVIWFLVGGDSTGEGGNLGSFALIDDLSWGGVVAVEKVNSNIPSVFAMQQNYPNPFNPSTTIEYAIPKESFVELKVYDIIGNELTTLVSEYQPAGRFRAEFNAANLSSGIYIAKLTAGSFTKSMKMTLMK